jgi:hypothetical protein
MGHQNQSIALAKHLQAHYDVLHVSFTCKLFKALSYALDWFGFYTKSIVRFESNVEAHYDAIVCAGSGTYYAAKVLARELSCKSICMMLPKGYRYDFDLIFAQAHDAPKPQENIVTIPANMSFIEPKGLFCPNRKSIGVIVGGSNASLKMETSRLKTQLDFIFYAFKDYEIAVTTSPRTPKEVETLLENYPFAYRVLFSQNPINPIADFLTHCEVVFITMDSTSMLSEAISYGHAFVEILPLKSSKNTKFDTFCAYLETEGYAHIFNNTTGTSDRKIDFSALVHKALA